MNEKAINLLCEKLHTTAEQLIPAYSHYMIGKDIGILVICIILMLIGFFLINYCKKKEEYGIESWEFHHVLIAVTGGCVMFITLLFIFFNTYDLILWITAPEMRFLDVVVSPK